MNARWVLATVALLFVCCITQTCNSEEPAARLPPGVTLEATCPDASLNKIVFVAGSNFYKPGEHEYIGGCAVMMDLVRQTPGVFPVLALDWPRKAETFAGAKAVVFFLDGGDKHPLANPNRLAEVQQLAKAGIGIVGFHQFVDISKELGPAMRELAGAAWEKGHSQRGHWVTEFKTFPEHAITRGVTPFKIDDGWLFKLRFVDDLQGVAPLLRTVSPKNAAADPTSNDAIVSWAYQRPERGRTFIFNGCHLHSSFAETGYRRFLTNGILWAAGLEVPAGGAPAELDAAKLSSYLVSPAAK